jgi:hypothetical protein
MPPHSVPITKPITHLTAINCVMRKPAILLSALCLAAGIAHGQNLLLNGNFNSPASGAWPDSWSGWSWGSGWANHENNGGVTYDGSYYIVAGAGNYDSGGGGFFQTVSGSAGQTYQLSVLSGADAWWLPYGEMRLFFLDSGNNQLGPTVVKPTVDPAVYGNNYDIPHPWAAYSVTATAPEGTSWVKVEFTEPHGTGSVWFENASLSVVPEPGTLTLAAMGAALLVALRRSNRRS